jgi:hypothetical protein
MRAGLLVLALLVGNAADAAEASGRNWRVSIASLECRPFLSLRIDIGYLGPPGPVEAPVTRLVDAAGKRTLPKSVAWKPGSRPLAEWLSAGGLRNLKPEALGEVELKFDREEATGVLNLEFGDIPAFAVTRSGKCLGSDQLRAPRAPAPRDVKPAADFPVHRARYACTPSRTLAAQYPPYLPRQLLVFGRGYLPGAREIELPMGTAPAQPYLYSGLDQLDAVEQAARRALAADFPRYAAPSKYFAFNWGSQKSASGNEVYSIGIYELRPCPK